MDRTHPFVLVLFSVLTLLTAAARGQTTRPTVAIARFAGDRPAAIAYTFDDNLRDQYTLAVPMLDDVGFKGTFFVIAGKTADTPEQGAAKKEDGNPRNLWGGISWPELKEMADHGHEIASHTWSHPSLIKLPPDELDAQFRKACDAIQTHIGKPALTVAFPGNGSNAQVQAAALNYHVAARLYQQSTSGKSTTASLNAWADKLVQTKAFGILMVHGIQQGYAALTDPAVLRDHLRYVKGREHEIWVATLADIARYKKERDDATLNVDAAGQRATCLLTGTLDSKRYDVPLTIVLSVPGAQAATATRSGKPLPTMTLSGRILVDAVPSPEPIQVQWTVADAK